MTRSLWLAEALGDVPRRPPLAGDVRCDVCIVGGGFTGLWTALADPRARAVRRHRGAGGRRVRRRRERPQRRVRDDDVVEVRVAEEARADRRRRLAGAAGGGVGLGHRPVLRRPRHRRRLPAQRLGVGGDQRGAARRVGRDAWRRSRRPASARRWSRSSRRRWRGCRARRRTWPACSIPTSRTCSRRCWRAAWRGWPRRAGIRIHEGTAMTALGRTSPPTVTTARGTVHAGAVVLAVNAWAARLPEVRRSLVVTSSDVIATPPIAAAARADRLDLAGRPVRVRLAAARELLPPDARRPRGVRQGRRPARAGRPDRRRSSTRRRAAPTSCSTTSTATTRSCADAPGGCRAGAGRSTTRWTACRSCTACRARPR